MTKNHPVYLAYLLRLWQVNSDNGPENRHPQHSNWRASLEEPGSRKRIGFSSLEALFEYLMAQADLPRQRGSVQTVDKEKEQLQ